MEVSVLAASLSRRFLLAGALGLGLLHSVAAPLAAHEFKAGPLEIKHPWSRATVPAAKVAAGYFTVVNPSDTPDHLISATAEIAGITQIYQMTMKDGVMSMREIDGGIEVPAKGELALQPGGEGAGYHIMFMDLKRPLVGGEKFPGTLTFEKAGTVAVKFAVEGMGETGSGQDHSQHGG